MADEHIIPLDDLVEHSIDEDCVCQPRLELVQNGGDYWLAIHHSLDGRETAA